MDAPRPTTEQGLEDVARWLDRRRHSREPIFTAGVIFPEGADDDTHRRSIYVFNVSCGGVGFRSPTALVVGSVYGIRIGAGPLHLSARITIVSRRPRPDGTCDIGGEFL